MVVNSDNGAVLVQRDHTGATGADGGLRLAGRGLVAEPVFEVAGLIVGVVLLEYVDDLHKANFLTDVQPATPRK